MTQSAINYAKAIFELGIPEESVSKAKNIIIENKDLLEALSSPTVKISNKHTVIDDIFDKEIRSFFKVLCDNESISIVSQIFEAYEELVLESKNIIKATITYVQRPDDKQLEQIKEIICKKYNKSGVLLELKEDFVDRRFYINCR